MKQILLAAGLSLFALQASAATCEAMAGEKKLAGAAKSSYIQKCEKDARASCEAAAGKQKLAGAAKNSNVMKCMEKAAGVRSTGYCEFSADAKKLSGAARTSHIKKCMTEG